MRPRQTDGSAGRARLNPVGDVQQRTCNAGGHVNIVRTASTLMTSTEGLIEPIEDDEANIGRYLEIGRYRSEED